MPHLSLDNMKFVDQYTIDLVHGYINESLQYLPIDNVPKLVTTTCILFCFIKEHFHEYGNCMTINETLDIISMRSVRIKRNTVYGMLEINPKTNTIIYIWTIKILKHNGAYNIYIGIDSSQYPFYYRNADFTNNDGNPHYSYGSSGRIYCFEDTISGEEYGKEWTEGDIIKMKLHTKNKTLKYYVNNIDQGIAFKNIEMKNKIYHMVVSLCSKHNNAVSVQIIESQKVYCK
eukprot:271557_1